MSRVESTKTIFLTDEDFVRWMELSYSARRAFADVVDADILRVIDEDTGQDEEWK